jgi:hypothetical protein
LIQFLSWRDRPADAVSTVKYNMRHWSLLYFWFTWTRTCWTWIRRSRYYIHTYYKLRLNCFCMKEDHTLRVWVDAAVFVTCSYLLAFLWHFCDIMLYILRFYRFKSLKSRNLHPLSYSLYSSKAIATKLNSQECFNYQFFPWRDVCLAIRAGWRDFLIGYTLLHTFICKCKTTSIPSMKRFWYSKQ